MRMKKKEFCNILKRLQATKQLNERIENAKAEFCSSVYNDDCYEETIENEITLNYEEIIVNLLSKIWNLKIDDSSINPIEKYVYRSEYGKYLLEEIIVFTDRDGEQFTISTPENLYNCLISAKLERADDEEEDYE